MYGDVVVILLLTPNYLFLITCELIRMLVGALVVVLSPYIFLMLHVGVLLLPPSLPVASTFIKAWIHGNPHFYLPFSLTVSIFKYMFNKINKMEKPCDPFLRGCFQYKLSNLANDSKKALSRFDGLTN